MADAPPKEQQTPPSGRKRTALLLAGLLVGEAALILGAVMIFSRPAEVQADGSLEMLQVPEDEKIVEQLVVDGRFPNSRRGVTYLYDSEIYVQIKRRHQDQVAAELSQFRNEIKADITAVWRTSEPQYFDEPKLENLTRKVYALLNERFGADQETGEPIIRKVVIVMGTGLRVDG